jgi:hypothetical protein
VLRNLLNPIIDEFLANESAQQLCLNPSELYRNWINKLESESGVVSGMDYDVTNTKALEYSEVRRQLEINIQNVKVFTSKFLQLILKSIDKIPYGLRYIAKMIRNNLKMKFPTTNERELVKIVGNLVYYRFLNSAICSPDAYDIIDVKAGNPLTGEQRKSLACISKHLQLISMSKGYGDAENAHLACLNPFIKESHEYIRSYFNQICNVPEADDYFGISEYSDLIIFSKPVVYMTVSEVNDTHRLLVQYLDKIVPSANNSSSRNDPFREIINSLEMKGPLNVDILNDNLLLKSTNSIESTHLHRQTSSAGDPQSGVLNKNTQICLTLNNTFILNHIGFDEKTHLNDKFIRTKKFIVDLIQCQNNNNMNNIFNSSNNETLIDLLETKTNCEEEKIYIDLLKKRQQQQQQQQKQQNSENEFQIVHMSLDNLKREIKKNLNELEKAKMVSKKDCYQAIVSRVAQDIRNQRKYRQRRQKELNHLNDVDIVLTKKHHLLKEQVSFYNEYVKACLDSFNNKKR